MKSYLLLSCAALCAACSSTSTSDPLPDAGPDTTPDASPDAPPASDAGTDAPNDAPSNGGPAVLHVIARDVSVVSNSLGRFPGSRVVVRAGAFPVTTTPPGSCIYFGPPPPAPPTLTNIGVGGLVSRYEAVINDGFGFGGYQLLPQGAAPAPMAGSQIESGHELLGPPDPFTVELKHGAPTRTARGQVVPPAEAPTLTAPAVVPDPFDADFDVSWSSGGAEAYVEVELADSHGMNEGENGGTVVCRPAEGGSSVTVPYVEGRPAKVVRITVLAYARADVVDERGETVSVVAERGDLLAP